MTSHVGSRWNPPTNREVKMNVAVAFGNDGSSLVGVGAVVRDHYDRIFSGSRLEFTYRDKMATKEETQIDNNVLMTPETQPNDVPMTQETKHKDGVMTEETQNNDQTEETQHNNGLVAEESQQNEELVTQETQHSEALVTHETQHKEELVTQETQHDEALVTQETQHNDGMMAQETQHEDGLMAQETQHEDGMIAQETQHEDGMMAQETEHEDGMLVQETEHVNGMLVQETEHDDGMLVQVTQHEDGMMVQDTQHDDVLMTQETHPNDVLMTQETQPNDMLMTETQPNDMMMMTETQPDNALAIPEMQPNNQLAITEMRTENALAILNTQPNNEVISPETQPSKRRKKKSIVWEHFTIETVSAGCRRACCKQCKQSFAYSTGSKVAGTSHLKRHIAKGTCPALLRNQDNNNQLTPYAPRIGGSEPPKRRYRSPNVHEWKLQRRILNVVMEPYPDSDTSFSHAVAACLSDWSMEGKVFSLTFSHSLSEAGLDNLRPLLCIKNTLILNGQLLVRNCIARTLSTMAKDVLGAGSEIVKKIRDSVKYVKISESHEEKFLELKQQLQVPSEKSLSLDDVSKWNTTYQMLVAASELKEVFSCLDTSDPDYKEAPSMEDWRLVETICAFLKPLFDAAIILTTTTNPTAITFFHEAWKILSDLTRALTTEDPFVSSLTKAMHETINGYWKDCCLVLAIAVVMDPRFKMKLVEFSFTKIYGDDAPAYIKIVDDGIHELFLEYVALPLPLTPTYAEEGNNAKTDESQGGTLLSDNGLTDFDVYIMETSSHQMKSELDQYLEESLLPRVQDFDVLGWWKLNKMKYPTLSKMARDILSIPVALGLLLQIRAPAMDSCYWYSVDQMSVTCTGLLK
ncbi:hypothetical protein LWI29_019309 [Acer saccharum]|uniref:BED-type domain-containing protein n=1 Tax=Acer saccharum TaxID=4024 RepID=A0AA39RDE8_ACESA|nr:hypothetical protein LWI29_019309 [Acer saccharum]